MKKYYRLFLTVLIWSGLIIRLCTIINLGIKNHNIGLYLNVYFSYFTIESNLLLAILFTILTIKAFKNKKFSYPMIKGAIILYITITGIVYTAFLAPINHPQGWIQVSTWILHFFTPPLAIIDWFLFEERQTYRYHYSLVWLIYPLIYFIYVIIRGILIDKYPYPFINVDTLHYQHVLINALLFTIVFYFLGILYIKLNKSLK